MAIEDFFIHSCNIYHLKYEKDGIDLGYGIKSDKYTYSNDADIKDVSCHFSYKTLEQFAHNTPHPSFTGRVKLALPVGTDIRLNDKVVNNLTGLEYIAEMPHQIRKNHIIVYLMRTDEEQMPKEGGVR